VELGVAALLAPLALPEDLGVGLAAFPMSVAHTASPVTSRRVSRLFTALLAIATVLVVRFVLKYVVPYLSMDPQYFGDYLWPRRYGLLAHLTGGSIAISTGLAQLWLGERRVYMHVHRTLGKVYLGGVALGCAGGLYLALTTTFSWVYASGLVGLAGAWAITTGMAYYSVRRRAITQHREWMIRSYVVTMAFVFFRVGYEVLERYNVAQPGRSEVLAWGCWAVPLLLTEPLLQLRHARKRHSTQGIERHA
jgi:hypothetical protein